MEENKKFDENIQRKIDKTNERKNIDTLNEIYRNTQMGKTALEHVIKKVNNAELKEMLLRQYDGFDALSVKIASELTRSGETPRPTSSFQNMMLKTSIGMNSFMDDTVSNLADMVIKGNNTGITEINKSLNDNRKFLTEETNSLAVELLEMEQRNIDALKRYL